MQVVDSEGYLKVKLVGGPVGPFVPYTGATANVDLGEYEIKAGQLELDQTPTGTAGVAVMRWNDQDGTADLGLKGGNVTLQVGQEQVTRVVNKTGVNLLEANYQAVRVDGAQGNRLKVALAQANNDANSADTLGLVTETINDNQEGFVTVSGLVRNINTTGSIQTETWLDGDVLYLSGTVAGQITNVKPTAPIHTVIMGYVVRAHATQGQIYVKVDNGYELDELHNVAIVTPLNDQVLQYETATSLWKNKTISSGITIGTTAITSGTVGRVLFEGTGNVVQESANLFWDETNARLGIGTSSPTNRLEVQGGDVRFANALTIGDGGSTGWQFSSNTLKIIQNGYLGVDVAAGREFNFTNTSFSTTYLKLASFTGNVLINTTTDAGYKLDVNGNTRINGDITANRVLSSILRDGNNNTYISNSLINIASTNLAIGGTTVLEFTFTTRTSGGKYVFNNANVLINTTTDAGYKLDVNGTARVQNTTTITKGGANYITFEPSANGTTPFIQGFFAGAIDARIYFDNVLKLRSGGTSTVYGLDCGNIAANGNIIVSGGTEHKIQLAGSTNNYIQYTDAGAINIGVIGTADATSYIQVRTGNATNMSTGTLSTAFFNTGNVGINTTTDAGYKLDVNGTARVSGNFTMPSGTSLTVGSIQLFDDTAGVRIIQALSNQGLLIRAGSNTLTLNNSASGGNTSFSTTGTYFIQPNGIIGSGGINIFGSSSAPSSTTISFKKIRNDGAKSGIINTEDFATSGITPINLFIYAGKETVLNNQADLILCHDGTSSRGKLLVGTATAGASTLRMVGLPTSATGLSAGDIWNDAGTLKIV